MSIDELIKGSAPLAALFSKPLEDRHAGHVFRMDYERALVMTNDAWRQKIKGIPQNCFLIASTLDPHFMHETPEPYRVVLLLRVIGPADLPQDREKIAAIIEHYGNKTSFEAPDGRDGIDPHTHAALQWSAIECRVLGSFYQDGNNLCFGADAEDYASVAPLRVYKPHGKALRTIVEYADPLRLRKSREDAIASGFSRAPESFRIGVVRYTSTNRLQRDDGDNVEVSLQTVDVVSKRTAAFGMTRTGKSNMIKTLVSAAQVEVMRAGGKIGQLVLDLNGEYANANAQDAGAISTVFDGNVVRYRDSATPGFFDVRPNYYKSLEIGLENLQQAIEGQADSEDFNNFVSLKISQERPSSLSEATRWEVKVAAYRSLLYASEFRPAADDMTVHFTVGAKVLAQIHGALPAKFNAASNDQGRAAAVIAKLGDPSKGLALSKAAEFFQTVREAERALRARSGSGFGLVSSSGKAWLEPPVLSMLSLMVGKSTNNDGPIRGRGTLNRVSTRHSASGSSGIDLDIYNHLSNGRIIIVDLSSSMPSTRLTLMEQIAKGIFDRSLTLFTQGKKPPAILIYIEEAHNLIGRDSKPDDTWPRLAKEGAKANIGLIYATQEPSSIQPNILANTENIISAHLNNDDEIRALSKYYDFAEFGPSIKHAQDVGFVRLKRLSAPFVVPTQVDEFKPDEVKRRYTAATPSSFTPAPKPPEAGEVATVAPENFGLEDSEL
jgi:hypothetical protein